MRAALEALGARVDAPPWDAEVDWAAYDAVLIRTTWDYHERRAEFVAWSERVASVTRLFHGPDVVRWNTDKSYLRALAAAGIPLAETVWLALGTPRVEALRAVSAAAARWGRAFLKPIVGANAWRTLAFAHDEAGLEAAARLLAAPGDGPHLAAGFMLQPYLPSVEAEGERSVIWIDGALSHGVAKVPARGDYRVQEDWGASDVGTVPDPELADLATRAITAAETILGQRLLFGRADALRDRDGRLVLVELELVEPCLFFRHGPDAGERLARALWARL